MPSSQRRITHGATTGPHSCISNSQFSCSGYIRPPSYVVVIRHGERMDNVFYGWTKKCQSNSGLYTPCDLNMPEKLPIDRPLAAYVDDTPLTVAGCAMAQLIGRGLMTVYKIPSVIYCSPALRCLQTAALIRDLSMSSARIRVEPGLYEMCSTIPVVPTSAQRAVFKVDESYQPLKTLEQIFGRSESIDEYNNRISSVIRSLSLHEECVFSSDTAVVLIVGHASTVDIAVGTLARDGRATTRANMNGMGVHIPYCGMAFFSRNERQFIPIFDILPSITYRNFTNAVDCSFLYR